MSEEPEDYAVGYGRPPVHTRFRKGRSGNPSGRPKGTKSLQGVLAQELKRKVQAQRGGKTIRISALEAIVARMLQKAMQGDPAAVRLLWTLMGTTGVAAEAERPTELGEGDRLLLETFAAGLGLGKDEDP